MGLFEAAIQRNIEAAEGADGAERVLPIQRAERREAETPLAAPPSREAERGEPVFRFNAQPSPVFEEPYTLFKRQPQRLAEEKTPEAVLPPTAAQTAEAAVRLIKRELLRAARPLNL